LNTQSLKTPSKVAVTFAALGVGIGWLFMAAVLLSFILIFAAVVGGVLPKHVSVPPFAIQLILICFGIFISCSSIYLFIALSLHCPHCGFKFVKNPKGLGPTGFVYHPNCPKKRGFNPWAVQICRFLAVHRIRCVNCGEEVFK
jgi:hypothetical protein